MLKKRIFLILIPITCFGLFANAQAGASSTQPSYRLVGSATLASNFVDKGLTQTKADPGLQTDFWFNFGSQFRMGLWGANVRYESTPTTHFWLKGNADVKVDFSENTNMNIIYTENKFYKDNRRSGNTVGIHFNFWGWKIAYDMEGNWQGTRQKATYASAGKDSPVFGDYVWSNTVGYTMPEADGVTSYFDIRSGIGAKIKDFVLMGTVTSTTAARDFKTQGELAFLLSATVGF